jgi:glycyl-tRNA synthetase beta chain
LEQGIPADTFNAVRLSHLEITDLHDCDKRVRTIEAFKRQPQAQPLIAANKRIANILKKTKDVTATIDTTLFEAEAETQLHTALTATQREMSSGNQSYEARCLLLAGLQTQVDEYFDEVMVMADDEKVRQNRLATLYHMRLLFLEVADFSVLQ